MKKQRLYILLMLLAGIVVVSCTNPGGSGSTSQTYPRIVVETYVYASLTAATETNLALYDSTGTLLALSSAVPPADPNNPSGRIDYTGSLKSGTYYIKITDNGVSGGPYVIRALSLALTDAFPADIYPGTIANETWPDGDDASTGNIPAAPVSFSLGASNYLNRALDKSSNGSFDPGDIDWCKLVLP